MALLKQTHTMSVGLVMLDPSVLSRDVAGNSDRALLQDV
jgi:hypothetical protein